MKTNVGKDRIRALNDAFRQTFIGGRVMMTSGVDCLDVAQKAELMAAVRGFDRFDKSNDPHSEHDFGAIVIGDNRYYWKIDYYNLAMSQHSVDSADPEATIRVLTIMRSDEY